MSPFSKSRLALLQKYKVPLSVT